MGKCPICGKDKYKDGRDREINACSYCGKRMCFYCWSQHTGICEIKKERFKKEIKSE